MKALLSILIVITMFFAGCSSSYAFGKLKAKKTTTSVETVSEGTSEATAATTKKSKKIKKDKVQKEKVKKAKKVKTKSTTTSEQQVSTSGTVASDSPKTTKKSKKAKKSKPKDSTKASTPQTTAERENKKRTFIGKFLNPNIDVYEIRASHILVRQRKDAVSIRKDILNGDITFEEAAKRYSLCPTGPYGGDLGYFNRRKMDQLFSDVAFDLKVGEISDPVGTKFGWHLIKVVDKR